jgi:hypothetical protein
MMRRAALAGLAMLALTGANNPDAVSDGPLGDAPLRPGVLTLPPLSSVGANGLRIQIAPSFSQYYYAVDFAPQPMGCLTPHGGTLEEVKRDEPRFCTDVLVIYTLAARLPPQGKGGRWVFHIPVVDYRGLLEGLDARLDGWHGPGGLALVADGTFVGVERVRNGKVRSAGNNYWDALAPNNPATFAKAEVQRLLLIYGPSGKVPRDADWNISDRKGLPFDPCAIPDFAVPDHDGYGVGGDACARALKGGGKTSKAKKAG